MPGGRGQPNQITVTNNQPRNQVEPPRGGTSAGSGATQDFVTLETGGDVTDSSREDPNLRTKYRTDQLKLLQYPLKDLTGGQHRHVMRIDIYTQNAGSEEARYTGIVPGNRFDKQTEAAGANYNPTGITVGGFAEAAAARGAENAQSIVNDVLTVASNFVGRGTARNFAKWAVAGNLGFSLAKGAVTLGSAIAVADLDVGAKTTSKQTLAYINLYMPETLSFINQQDFDAVSLTEAMGLAGRLSQPGSTFGAENLLAIAADSGITDSTNKYRDFYLQKNAGYALNPQLEILYTGPKNREFVFSFKFTPRSTDEANEVWGIIRTLRYHAAPEYSFEKGSYNSRHIVPPSQFGISFWVYPKEGAQNGSPEENTNLPRIGQCVLTNVDVNYAPTGKFATFTDGMPVEIQMQLTFTETVILTKQDIKNGF